MSRSPADPHRLGRTLLSAGMMRGRAATPQANSPSVQEQLTRPHPQCRYRHAAGAHLLADDRAVRVGAIQALDYNRAVVITTIGGRQMLAAYPSTLTCSPPLGRSATVGETTMRSCYCALRAQHPSLLSAICSASVRKRSGTPYHAMRAHPPR